MSTQLEPLQLAKEMPAKAVAWSAHLARRRLAHLLSADRRENNDLPVRPRLSRLELTKLSPELKDVPGVQNAWLDRIVELELHNTYSDATDYVRRWVENPLTFVTRLWGSVLRESDVQFFYFRDVCKTYGLTYGSECAGAFYSLGATLNEIFSQWQRAGASSHSEVAKSLLDRLFAIDERNVVNAFLECCFSASYFRIQRSEGVRSGKNKDAYFEAIPRGDADAEFLLSKLFSLPTASTGFNQLFGGSGPLVTLRDNQSTKMPGRVQIVTGRFGTGKTAFALSWATEAVRKGGICWYFSTEQAVSEVLFSLRTINSGSQNDIRVITDIVEAYNFVTGERASDKGALIVLCLKGVDHESVWTLLKQYSDYGVELGPHANLRLAIVDSLNGIEHSEQSNQNTIRSTVSKGLDECTASGMNLLLITEQRNQTRGTNYEYVQNIADLVVELTVEAADAPNAHGYARRYIQILKSRYQRDQRGRHSFSIKAPTGLEVVPSTAAVQARVAGRRHLSDTVPEGFGIAEIDEILGRQTFRTGELTVLQGDPGTFKSILAAAFLNGIRPTPKDIDRRRRIGLLLTMRTGIDGFREHLSAVAISKEVSKSINHGRVRICRIPAGFVTPGQIMQLLDEAIEGAQRDGFTVARVVLDDIGEWSNYSPFIKSDASFGPTLFDYLSRYPFLVLATLNEFGNRQQNDLQQIVVESAARLIELERFAHGGRQRALLRIVSSPRMVHKRDSYEIRMDDRGKLQVDTRPSLFEVANGHKRGTAGVELFLQTESVQQHHYNLRIREQLRTTLSPNVDVKDPNLLNGVGDLSDFSLSVISNLQIMQVDGFRLSHVHKDARLPKLHPLDLRDRIWRGSKRHKKRSSASESQDEREEGLFLPRFAERMRNPQKTLLAVPYYDNLSFMTYDREKLDKLGLSGEELDWPAIAEASQKVASDSKESVFFDFPQSSDQNLNCLFLEILLSLTGKPLEGFDQLQAELLGPTGLKAMMLFSEIASPCANMRKNWEAQLSDRHRSQAAIDYAVSGRATVWRHWFTTYHQMMTFGGYESKPATRGCTEINFDNIWLRSLPGLWTTSGEWFLCVPENSAVPAAGNSIIELLIDKASDRERFDLGVGLPVRRDAYSDRVRPSPPQPDDDESGESSPITSSAAELTLDFFDNLRREPKLRRDKLPGYTLLSPFLANWLRRVLSTSSLKKEASVSKALSDVLERMLTRVDNLRKEARKAAS